jgi:acetyl-CoA synthetase
MAAPSSSAAAAASAPAAPPAAPGGASELEAATAVNASPFGEVDSAPTYAPPARVAAGAHVASMAQYRAAHARSVGADAPRFWAEMAREHLAWTRPFSDAAAAGGGFASGDVRYFADGQLNASFNCLDRHVLAGRGERVAIIHEADEPGAGRSYTYAQALEEVCRLADVLLAHGVRRGDAVAVYLPNAPELAFTMLACARIGAVHNVVFAGFSAESLRDRILDAKCKWLVTSDEARRGGRALPLKPTVDAAVAACGALVQRCFVFRHAKSSSNAGASAAVYAPARDVRMELEMPRARPFVPAVAMDSEDPLFLLYTSGSTGKPKGLVHTTGGYLLYAALTHKLVFDVREGDVYACMADGG